MWAKAETDAADTPPQARSRYCLFKDCVAVVSNPDVEYEHFMMLGPKARRVLNEDAITQWSAIDIVREVRERNLDVDKQDGKIAVMILRADRAAFGNRGHNGHFE